MSNTELLSANPRDPTDDLAAAFWSAGARQDIGSRAEQQDSFRIQKGTWGGMPALLVVLADGMGGMKNGAEFSRIAVDYHSDHFQEELDAAKDPRHVLIKLAYGANKETHKIYDEDKPGGTTLISALFVVNMIKSQPKNRYVRRMYFLSVGDSRIYLFRKNPVLNRLVPLQLNREHVLGATLDERAWMGKISFEDAEENMYRDSLVSGLGPETIRRIDFPVNSIRLLRGDKVVLMSDGIYRSLSEEEMAADLEKKPDEASDEIVKHVIEKKQPRQDNMSIVIIERQ